MCYLKNVFLYFTRNISIPNSATTLKAPQQTSFFLQMGPLVCQFVPIARIDTCPDTGHHWKELGSYLFAHALQGILSTNIDIDKIPLTLLFSRLKRPISLSLMSQDRCSSPLIIQYFQIRTRLHTFQCCSQSFKCDQLSQQLNFQKIQPTFPLRVSGIYHIMKSV